MFGILDALNEDLDAMRSTKRSKQERIEALNLGRAAQSVVMSGLVANKAIAPGELIKDSDTGTIIGVALNAAQPGEAVQVQISGIANVRIDIDSVDETARELADRTRNRRAYQLAQKRESARARRQRVKAEKQEQEASARKAAGPFGMSSQRDGRPLFEDGQYTTCTSCGALKRVTDVLWADDDRSMSSTGDYFVDHAIGTCKSCAGLAPVAPPAPPSAPRRAPQPPAPKYLGWESIDEADETYRCKDEGCGYLIRAADLATMTGDRDCPRCVRRNAEQQLKRTVKTQPLRLPTVPASMLRPPMLSPKEPPAPSFERSVRMIDLDGET